MDQQLSKHSSLNSSSNHIPSFDDSTIQDFLVIRYVWMFICSKNPLYDIHA